MTLEQLYESAIKCDTRMSKAMLRAIAIKRLRLHGYETTSHG